MANPWFRMYSEFATDPKVQSMSEAMQRRLMMLFCMRCSNTLVTLQEDEIAFALRIDDEELAATKALFIRKGFINDAWEINNWEKRQFSSDSSAERVARHREKKKSDCNADVTLPKQPSNALDTEADTDTEQKQKKTVEPKQRATRLPADWVAPDEYIAFCQTERPDLDPEAMQNKFRDYWVGVPGAKGTKLDWAGTWRNFIRGERKQQAARASPAGKPEKFDPVAHVNRNRVAR
jgi:hypothetical protein